MLRRKNGQSTLEYVIVFTAIVGAIIVAANTIVKKKVGNMIEHVAGQAETAVEHIDFEK